VFCVRVVWCPWRLAPFLPETRCDRGGGGAADQRPNPNLNLVVTYQCNISITSLLYSSQKFVPVRIA